MMANMESDGHGLLMKWTVKYYKCMSKALSWVVMPHFLTFALEERGEIVSYVVVFLYKRYS